MSISPVINPIFRKDVESHLWGNFLIHNTNSPLILGIFGPPGEGKTFQLEKICNELNIKQLIVSPGELENENAGHPAQLLRKLYLEAGSLDSSKTEPYKPAIIVINDIDTVLGDWGTMTQYTVNRQIVYGQLMSFCDFPYTVSGHNTMRVPIVITGNNSSILYQPLLRAGRMRIMTWKPSLSEKVEIISGIFPDLEKTNLADIVNMFPNEPVSFWSDIASRYWEEQIYNWIGGQTREQLMAALSNKVKYEVSNGKIQSNDIIRIARS